MKKYRVFWEFSVEAENIIEAESIADLAGCFDGPLSAEDNDRIEQRINSVIDVPYHIVGWKMVGYADETDDSSEEG